MTEPTPGPWTGRDDEIWADKRLVAVVTHPYNADTIICDIRVETMEEARANVRLIAAVRELLDSCEEILDYRGGANSPLDDEYVMGRLRAAIAKARGES